MGPVFAAGVTARIPAACEADRHPREWFTAITNAKNPLSSMV